MSRIDMARLEDLTDVLQQVRAWGGVEDRGGGTFYLKRKPYLHFHIGQDRRRADIRRFDGWVQFDLPEPLPVRLKQEFLALLQDEYAGR